MLFVDFYKDIIRYVPERKSWFFYEDGIWQQDVGDLKVVKLCMELANLLHMYALKIPDEFKRKEYMNNHEEVNEFRKNGSPFSKVLGDKVIITMNKNEMGIIYPIKSMFKRKGESQYP